MQWNLHTLDPVIFSSLKVEKVLAYGKLSEHLKKHPYREVIFIVHVLYLEGPLY